MRAQALAGLLLVAAGLAGCLGTPGPEQLEEYADRVRLSKTAIEAQLTQPIYKTVERLETVIDGADGTKIWVAVFRPGDATEGVPVILVMTPYQALGDAFNLDPTGQEPYDPDLVEYYVPRGYAVAFADVRGNHNSGGCVDQTGPKQWQDGYNVIEWLGSQDWSSGSVGMIGVSYDGETQISNALLNPPSLKTIVPIASVSNQYEYIYYDGVPYETQGLGTMGGYLAISMVPGTNPNAATTYHERFACQHENFENALDLSGDWNQYWQDRDYRPLAPGIQASVLQVHGLQDWNVKPNHLDGLWNQITSEKRLILGQWGHAFLQREDAELILHRWFDHWLHGIDTGILQDLPPVLTQDDADEWRGIDSFPPVNANTTTLWLGADGTLATEPAAEGEATIHDAPRDTLNFGSLTDPVTGQATEALTGHPVAVVFETEPLAQDLRYTGRPLLHLFATTSEASTHWAVHLIEVGSDGEEITNRGYLDTRHREGVDAPKDLTPGEQYHVVVRLFPQDDVIEAGNRIRIVVTNDDDWIHQDPTGAVNTILFGPEGTRLELPLAPIGMPVPEDKLREGL